MFRFGLDLVRFNFPSGFDSPLFESLFHGLSLNSAQSFGRDFFGGEFNIQLSSDGRQRKTVILSFMNDGCIHIEKVLDSGIAQSVSYAVTFYSTYFYINEIKKVLSNFIAKYKNDLSLSRTDLALDVDTTVQELWDCHRTQFKKKQSYENGADLETFYLGSKAYNKKHLIRVYNKKLDSRKKGKYHLFTEYLDQETVTRVELQLNVLSCKTFNIEPTHILDLFSKEKNEDAFNSPLWEIFRSCCLNSQGTDFPIIEASNIKETIKRPKNSKGNMILDEIPYARIMLGYARRLHGQGFDVIRYLRTHLSDDI